MSTTVSTIGEDLTVFQSILEYKNEQNKITEYFSLKKPEDIQYTNVEKEEVIKEETMKIR